MNISDKIDLAVLGAVPQETRELVHVLNSLKTIDFRGEKFHVGSYKNRSLMVGTTGIGKVNAAVTTGALLERFPIVQVLNVGCAGAYRNGPLGVGDVLVTSLALCGDEGVLTRGGVLSSREIGIPLMVRGQEEFYDRFPLERNPLYLRVQTETPAGSYRLTKNPPLETVRVHDFPKTEGEKRLKHEELAPSPPPDTREADPPPLEMAPYGECFQLFYGPSLTVGMVSGDEEIAAERFRLHQAFAENMEGSAIAQTCFRFNIPMLECRGISNVAGDRCKARWQIGKAMTHCMGIIANWLRLY